MTSFRSTHQRSHVCRTLLFFVNLETLWSDEGPTEEASRVLLKIEQREPCQLSSGERILVRVAFDFWNGSGKASIWDIQNYLDANVVHAIGSLLVAANEYPQLEGEPVDKWLRGWGAFRVNQAPDGGAVG